MKRLHASCIGGHYRGFFRSSEGAKQRGTVEFEVRANAPTANDFSGTLAMVHNGLRLPFAFTGIVEANGVLRGTGQGEAGRVAFLGWFRDLGRGAAFIAVGCSFVPTGGQRTHDVAASVHRTATANSGAAVLNGKSSLAGD